MMVPRAFAQNPLAQRQPVDFNEKDLLSRKKPRGAVSHSPPRSALSQSLSQQNPDPHTTYSDPVRIPQPVEQRSSIPSQRPAPTTLQSPRRSHRPQTLPEIPKRKESVQDVLSSTTIPIRRKPKPRSTQRIPNCDHVADFSKLLREDVQSTGEGSLSGSWTNPQFEGLFGNLDGLVEGQTIVGSEGIDAGMMSTRSLSSESMPSLASPLDFSSTDLSSFSPAAVRSPSDHRLRQMASSEDCSNQHPLLPPDDNDDLSGTTTPELAMVSPSRVKRKQITPEKRPSTFKSSLTASLKALKSAAQTVSNITSAPPLLQPHDFLSKSIFDFQPSLTDDRRPPPSDEPPSVALRRYLNPNIVVPADSPAQLHFWLDEKPIPVASGAEKKPKLKIKRKYQNQKLALAPGENVRVKGQMSGGSQLPPVVALATCIPSSIRTAHASSPPTWLEPDGTPSNKHRAAQALWENAEEIRKGEGQPRPREPRENRDFLRVFVCEVNMRKSGKLSDEAIGHARLWLPPVDDGLKHKESQKGGSPVDKGKTASERWTSWSLDDL